jgi:hypothetical protein
MTGNASDRRSERDDTPSRRIRIRTTHQSETVADAVASALRPDNTAEMETIVDRRAVVTTIERETTGGLHSTIDDYVVNLQVGVELANQHTTTKDNI